MADRPQFWRLAVFYIAYILAAGLGQGLSIIPGVSITFWPPAGIFVAALLLTPPRAWPWWVLAGCLAELTCNALWFHNFLHLALVYFSANAAEAVTAALLVTRFCRTPFRFERLGDVAGFILLAGAVAPVVGATIIAGTDALIGKHAFTTAWTLVWLGDGSGLLVSTPLALAAAQVWNERGRIPPARLGEGVAIALLIVICAILALTDRIPTIAATLPLLLWAALRFQINGAAVGLALLTLTTAYFTATGRGEFAGQPELMHQKIMALKMFLAIAAVSALVTAALSAQYHRALDALRSANEELETRVADRTAALSASELRLRLAQEAAELGMWEIDCATGLANWSDKARSLIGLGNGQAATLESLLDCVHPEDRPALEAKIERLQRPGDERYYHAEYRVVLPGGAVRWLEDEGRIERDAAGRAVRSIGLARDVTERKRQEERNDLLMRELNHRTKNILALVQSIARQTSTGDPADFVSRFSRRIQALAANQDLLIKSGWNGVDMRELVSSQLAHFKDLIGDRIQIDGPPIVATPAAAQTLGLAIHELATNAGKYGALSNDAGRVAISWIVEPGGDAAGRFRIVWSESGGPDVAPSGHRGFGTTVIERMSRLSLEAEVHVEYRPAGLYWRLECAAARVLENVVPARAEHGAAPVASGAGNVVLVVEDEPIVAMEIASELQRAGYAVLGPAASVTEAMRLLDERPCDAAVLDINLGRETSESVALRLAEARIPFLTVSAYARGQQPKAFRAAEFLPKPVDPQGFLAAVKRVLPGAAPTRH